MSHFQELAGKGRTNTSTMQQPTFYPSEKKYIQHEMSMWSLAFHSACDKLIQTFSLVVLG